MRVSVVLAVTLGVTPVWGQSEESPDGAILEAEARALLEKFLVPGADCVSLTQELRPEPEDYRVVFGPEFAERAEATYGPVWDRKLLVVAPKSGQTELLLWSADSTDLKEWNEKAQPFPGGYREVAGEFRDGIRIHRFKFVRPGERLGMAYDGLVRVRGHWRIFPKPWRIE